MNHEFPRPSFLHPEVGPAPFFDNQYRRGTFTRVAELRDVPLAVRARAKGKFVVKKYARPPGDPRWNELFPADVAFTADPARRTMPAIARELKRRHDLIADFFGKELPDLVVPTQFIVGEEETGDDRREKRLYEIQLKITELVEMRATEFDEWMPYFWGEQTHPKSSPAKLEKMLHRVSEAFSLDIINAMADRVKLEKIRREIEAATERARQFVAETGYIPYDLFKPDNFVITMDGLRIVDTNVLVRKSDDPYGLEGPFNRSIHFWEEVARRLAAAAKEEIEVRRAA